MHAVGATGIMQVFEIANHIWGIWENIHSDEKRWKEFNRKKPADWTNLQVKDARRGLAISHAGVGSHVTCSVVMDPDHLIINDN
jgi:acetyl-CoA C-acetyltransferase